MGKNVISSIFKQKFENKEKIPFSQVLKHWHIVYRYNINPWIKVLNWNRFVKSTKSYSNMYSYIHKMLVFRIQKDRMIWTVQIPNSQVQVKRVFFRNIFYLVSEKFVSFTHHFCSVSLDFGCILSHIFWAVDIYWKQHHNIYYSFSIWYYIIYGLNFLSGICEKCVCEREKWKLIDFRLLPVLTYCVTRYFQYEQQIFQYFDFFLKNENRKQKKPLKNLHFVSNCNTLISCWFWWCCLIFMSSWGQLMFIVHFIFFETFFIPLALPV